MTKQLHLMKLCVGSPDPDTLEAWQRQRFGDAPREHVTRMWPRREAELLPGGSIYWVFKGTMLARQTLIALEERKGDDNISRCALILSPELVRVAAVPRRPFQGWRYLAETDAPPDIAASRAGESTLPPHLARELANMGLL